MYNLDTLVWQHMPDRWDGSHDWHGPQDWEENADSFEPTDECTLERFLFLYGRSQHSYRWFQYVHDESDRLFRQVAHLPPASLSADPWKARCRMLLQQIREMIHSKICCHMDNEKDLWYFRVQNDKANLRKRIRELEVGLRRCQVTVVFLKQELVCLNWQRIIISLPLRYRFT